MKRNENRIWLKKVISFMLLLKMERARSRYKFSGLKNLMTGGKKYSEVVNSLFNQ